MPRFTKESNKKLEVFCFFLVGWKRKRLLLLSPPNTCTKLPPFPHFPWNPRAKPITNSRGGKEECEKHISTLCPGFLPLFFGIFTTGRAPLGAEKRLWTVTLMGAGCSGGRPRFRPAMRGDGMAAGSRRVGRGGEWLISGAVGQPGAGRKKKRAFYSVFSFHGFSSAHLAVARFLTSSFCLLLWTIKQRQICYGHALLGAMH